MSSSSSSSSSSSYSSSSSWVGRYNPLSGPPSFFSAPAHPPKSPRKGGCGKLENENAISPVAPGMRCVQKNATLRFQLHHTSSAPPAPSAQRCELLPASHAQCIGAYIRFCALHVGCGDTGATTSPCLRKTQTSHTAPCPQRTTRVCFQRRRKTMSPAHHLLQKRQSGPDVWEFSAVPGATEGGNRHHASGARL